VWLDEMGGWTTGMVGQREWLDNGCGWTTGVAGRREWLDDGSVTNKMGLVQNWIPDSNFSNADR
jgi:hypothetical protein